MALNSKRPSRSELPPPVHQPVPDENTALICDATGVMPPLAQFVRHPHRAPTAIVPAQLTQPPQLPR
jgi:hypothetical protein